MSTLPILIGTTVYVVPNFYLWSLRQKSGDPILRNVSSRDFVFVWYDAIRNDSPPLSSQRVSIPREARQKQRQLRPVGQNRDHDEHRDHERGGADDHVV